MSKKTSIDSVDAFITGLAGAWPDADIEFKQIFDAMDQAAREKYGTGRSTDQALRKTHGDWYEYFLAAAALRIYKTTNAEWLAVQLPNKTGYAAEMLYLPRFSALITDLKGKVVKAADVILESSNPDFAIVRPGVAASKIPDLPERVDISALEALRSLYKNFDQALGFDDIAGYLGTKFTLRPDRRLQLAHEGSLVKALYIHIQTRLWSLTPSGIRYYAAASRAGPADLRGLKTVATHSLITVNSRPQRAVDRVWVIRTMREAENMFAEIYGLSAMKPEDRAKALRAGIVVGEENADELVSDDWEE